MPFSLKRRDEASELETAPAKLFFKFFNSSIKKLTVEPVPMPKMVSGYNLFSMYLIACLATFIFEPLITL